jgi:hypothetical protein
MTRCSILANENGLKASTDRFIHLTVIKKKKEGEETAIMNVDLFFIYHQCAF